jgi:hypothetical protein
MRLFFKKFQDEGLNHGSTDTSFIRGNIVGDRTHESAGLTNDMDGDESDIGNSLIVPMAVIQHG